MVNTFAPARQFAGVAAETQQGQAVAMTNTILVTEIKPSDKITYLEDKALRGVMGTDGFNEVEGVGKAELEITGPVFADEISWWLRNALGDVAVTGTPTGSGATTLGTGGTAAGATSFPAVASIPAGTLVQIDTGPLAECVTTGTPSGSGPYTIPITTPAGGLKYAHAAGVAVTPILTSGPFVYRWALLNSGTGQPGSQTVTHYNGPTATSGARQYPGFSVSELDFKFTVESALLEHTVKGTSWPSVPAPTAPLATPGTTAPMPSWNTTIGIGGPASGGTLVDTVSAGEVNIKREVAAIFTATGQRTPRVIQRGGLSAEGKLTFAAVSDESALLYYLNNVQPQVQIIHTNGLTGANLLQIQIDIQQAAFTVADIDAKTAIGYTTTFKALFNTANAGGSGGMGPVTVSVTCAVPPNTF